MLYYNGRARIVDANGDAVSNAKLNFFLTTTVTPAPVYTDAALTVAHTQPIRSAANGFVAPIYLDPAVTYKSVVTDANDVALPDGTIDPVIQTPFSAAALGSILYPRTAAENAAGVTPAFYIYSPRPHYDLNREGGGSAATASQNATALANVALVIAQKGGGVIILPDDGIYQTNASLSFSESMIIQGCSQAGTTIKYTGSGTFLTMATGARNQLRDMTLLGTGKTGTGVKIGDTDFCGHHDYRNVNIQGFNVGVRFAAALYVRFFGCNIKANKYGVDYNAASGSLYSNDIAFYSTTIQFNDRSGIAASNTPIRNRGLKFYAGSIEGNGSENTALYPQIVLGALANFHFDTYVEYIGATPPDAFNVSSAGDGEISNTVISGSGNGVKSSSGGCSNIFIHNCRFTSTTTKCIDVDACPQILALHNEYDKTNTINHATSTDVTTKVAQIVTQDNAWTPTIKGGGTAGAPTYTIQTGIYSQVGNLVAFRCRVTISAKGGMVGVITIEGLPVASATLASVSDVFKCELDGVTVSGGNTEFLALLPSGSTSLQLLQGGSTAGSQIVDTQLAAATTVIISGTYQAAAA